MLVHPQFDPIALQLGPIAVHWYGICYLVAFGLFLWLANRRIAQPHFATTGWTSRDVEDLLFYGVLGVVIGGRLGYMLYYYPKEHGWSWVSEDPLMLFRVWEGGMAGWLKGKSAPAGAWR